MGSTSESASQAAARGTDEADPQPLKSLLGGDALADPLRRVYEVDPLVCRCGGTMRVISFITEPRVIERILDPLRRQKPSARGSPGLIATSPALA